MTSELQLFALELPEPARRPTTFANGTVAQEVRRLSIVAKDTGLESARRGDPDGYSLAIDTIRRLIASGVEISADDVRRETIIGSSAVGAAFGHLSKCGEIVCTGYRVSASPSRKQGLQRTWRKA